MDGTGNAKPIMRPASSHSESDDSMDMVDRLHGATKFTVRFAILMTGLTWFLSGAQISLSLFVALEPPRFPDCSAITGSSHAWPPHLEARQLQTQCDPHVPLDPDDCITPHIYLRPKISIVSTFDLPPTVCESRPWKSAAWVPSALFAGILVGALTLGPLSDKIGRRPTITFSVLALTLVSFYSTLASNIWLYGSARFAVGIFITGSALPSLVALSELAPNSKRQWILAVQALAFCAAAVYVAVLACLIPSWQVMTLLVTLPTFFFLFGCVCCAGVYIESPRWLAAKGRMEEAFSVWLRIAKISNVELPEDFTLEVFTKHELQAAHDVKLRSLQEVEEELSFMSVQQIVTPDNLKRVFRTFPTSVWMWICIWLWIVSGFIYYGILFDFKDVISRFHLDNAPILSPTISPSDMISQNVSIPSHRNLFPESPLDGIPLRVLSENSPPDLSQQQPPHAYESNPNSSNLRPMLNQGPNDLFTPPEGSYQQLSSNEVSRHQQSSDTTKSASSRNVANEEVDKNFQNIDPHLPTGSEEASAPGELHSDERHPLSPLDLPPQIKHIGFDIAKINSLKDIVGSVLDSNHTSQYKQALYNMSQSLQDETKQWLESAKAFPEEAQKAVKEYNVVPVVNQFVQDVHAQFASDDIMANYWRNVRIEGILVVCSFATEIPAYLLAMGLASTSWMGRRSTCTCFLFTGSCLLLCAWASKFLESPEIQKTLAIGSLVLGRCCIAAVFMLLYLYCAEIFPTSVRTSSLGFLSASARIGCIFAAPLAQYLDAVIPQGAVLCFGLSALLAALVTPSTLPETYGKPLYDSLDTLEEAYQNDGYFDEFFERRLNKTCGFFSRCTCCCGRLVRRCLAIPGDSRPTSFEARGQMWLKEQWKKTGKTRTRWNKYRDQAQRVAYRAKRAVESASNRDRANFVPLQDMMDSGSPRLIHTTSIELGEDIELEDHRDSTAASH
eukprot:Gregarina_sp_Poly_1__203@NODE_1047_length_5252_cov_120_237030_g727_i0_p1_GENE_NODE_1047_length_5252_cov_120_237030_g727_i0NODE_1047_length_5252_cov_120_237030_g727_i0_p1_ORF_typecomplete_len956_score108_82Sugar_tr/PF00083_24/2_8e35Sugar_tr/PF00083_24/1_3e17MFS_1/PF07690_16/4_6e20MFS_1/PF07690_16/3_3e10TRI12/PF06609_13/8_1e07TRI12/PF06609_13/3_9e03TRI12/PF06609_13/2e02MFS_3/PF05977_13/9_8e05MFS_3/PF05977_13/1_1MFS_4/PF06779_14/1_1e04MFS_4/PF06779_14/0_00015MFS_4/PF06779_14/0_6MFS_2/PF13347_6/0_00